MSVDKLDFTNEICELLTFSASVASTIRMCSAYNHKSFADKNAHNDCMWLSDMLHNFDIIAKAVQSRDLKLISMACDDLNNLFERYFTLENSFVSPPRQTLDRWKHSISCDDYMDVLKRIKAKCVEVIE